MGFAKSFVWFWYLEGEIALYLMATYKGVFFFHFYLVDKVMNYFSFHLAMVIFYQKKIKRNLNLSSKSLVCSLNIDRDIKGKCFNNISENVMSCWSFLHMKII